jgi:LacI family transcriptional regulator
MDSSKSPKRRYVEMPRVKDKVTIYDVAKMANVSPATASRVLSGSNYPVKEALRKRVVEAAKMLNYSPNMLARSLKSNTSNDIGVIIPTISNPFYSSVILGIEKEADKRGYNLLLCNTFRDVEKEKRYLQSLYEKQVKGVIISTLGARNIEEYIEKGLEFVLLDQKIDNLECSFISFDCFKGAYMAVEYLIQNGHRKIAFVSSPLTKWTRKETFKGYKAALTDNGIAVEEEYFLIGSHEEEIDEEGFEFKNGKEMADEFIKRKLDATAVLAVNDMTAFGFIQQMYLHGKRVPDDISVIGFDDISFAKMFSPPLTTVQYPAYEVGRLAAMLLLDKLSGNNHSNMSVNLHPKLVIRDSVKPLA